MHVGGCNDHIQSCMLLHKELHMMFDGSLDGDVSLDCKVDPRCTMGTMDLLFRALPQSPEQKSTLNK